MANNKNPDLVNIEIDVPRFENYKETEMKFRVSTNKSIITQYMHETKRNYLHFPGMVCSYHVNSATDKHINGYLWIRVSDDTLLDFSKCEKHIVEICREKIRTDINQSYDTYIASRKTLSLGVIAGTVIPFAVGLVVTGIMRFIFSKK